MRYLPLSPSEKEKILKHCGVAGFGDLIRQIPDDLQLKKLLDLEPSLSEPELHTHLGKLAEANQAAKMRCHLGQGVYDHSWPSVIDQMINRGEFLTAYTPYQPEVSQGTLQIIFEFQSMIADLLGMEVANASLYDGATSVVEAVLMCARLQNLPKGTVYVSEGVYGRVRELLTNYLEPLGYQVETLWSDPKTFRFRAPDAAPSEKPAAVVVQSPNKWGLIEDWSEVSAVAQKWGTRSVGYVAHPHALALFESPGACGIDVACGEAQPLGIPMGFGGPHLGIFACAKKDVRQMAGRLVGATVDAKGERAFCVTLSTREQHIRREKATSNICSNQNLMATRTALYLTLMGPEGLTKCAELCRSKALYARELLKKNAAGTEFRVLEGELFNEVTILVPPKKAMWTDEALAKAEAKDILAGLKTKVPSASGFVEGLTIAFTERHTKTDIEELVASLEMK